MKISRKIPPLLISGIVSCFGLGFFPKGSGTVASFFALGFWATLLIFDIPLWAYVLLCLFFTFFGTWAIRLYERRTRTEDSSQIVIDEWVGMGITLCFAKVEPLYLISGFLLFRLFDIWKPPGVRYFDEHHMGGWGVMLDDVVAGIYAALILGVYRWLA